MEQSACGGWRRMWQAWRRPIRCGGGFTVLSVRPARQHAGGARGCRIAGARRQAMGFGDRSDELGFWQDHDQHPDDLCAAETYERRSNELTIIWKLFER